MAPRIEAMSDADASRVLDLADEAPALAEGGRTDAARGSRPGSSRDVAALLMRLALGVVIFPHGARKMLGWFGGAGLQDTLTSFQEQLGIPVAVAMLVVLAEFCGALGVVLGLLTRWAAFGIGAVMAGAIVLRHARFGFFMNWRGTQEGEGFEYHLLVLGLALGLAVGGGGAWSLDAPLSRWRGRRSVRRAR